jgi:predicted P-loop ATPase
MAINMKSTTKTSNRQNSQGPNTGRNRVAVNKILSNLRSIADFALNELDNSIEVDGKRLDDVITSELVIEMRARGFKNKGVVLDAITALAGRNRYHPIHDYLDSLKWSGQPAIDVLCDHLDFEAGHEEYGRKVIRRWLIGAVAKAMEQGQNPLLNLHGPQDIGKSYLARWLCPPAVARYFIEGRINVDDKDTYLRLATKWLWDVGELQHTTRKADRAALKDFITRYEVTVRPPYGRHDLVKPALASLIGQANPEGSGFLDDPSGNRRFVVVSLESINWDYTQNVDVDQVWAEAYQLYDIGEPWRLRQDERDLQRQLNKEFEVTTPLEEMFLKFYTIDRTSNHWTPAIDIVLELEDRGLKGNQHRTSIELGALMSKLGVEKGRPRPGRQTSYKGVKLKSPSQVGP